MTTTFFPTFDRWQNQAKKAERKLKDEGHQVVRVYIDPDEIVAWCAANGHDLNGRGRKAYGNFIAHKTARNTH